MKRAILLLLPWMAAGAIAQSDGPRPAEVVFTHYGRMSTPAWQIGSECYVPLESVKDWGWQARINRLQATIIADGRTVYVPYRTQAGRQVIPLGFVVSKFGGGSAWKEGTGTFEVWSFIRAVNIKDGKLVVEATLPVRPQLSFLSNPSRFVMDFDGARLDSSAKISQSPDSRVAQFQQNTVRVAIDTDKRPAISANQILASRQFALNFGAAQDTELQGNDAIVRPVPVPPVDPVNQTAPPVNQSQTTEPPDDPGSLGGTSAPVQPASTAIVRSPVLLEENARGLLLNFKSAAPLMSSPQVRRLAADMLEVTLPGAIYEGDLNPAIDSKLVKEIQVVQGPASAIFMFSLHRPLGAELSTDKLDTRLRLIVPKTSGSGRLSAQTVVVDAGHGGHDSGAKAPDASAFEKNLTLAISKLLATELASEGATVIMTRKTDVFVPLQERAMIANRNSADIFVSVHINSNKTANSSTGGMTFYHKKDPVGMLLAECIQTEIAKVSKLKNLGAWSDQRIYDSGFAVLRHSKMPAVLIELGFINNSFDRKRMREASFQSDVAAAIVKGIKVYLGDEKS